MEYKKLPILENQAEIDRVETKKKQNKININTILFYLKFFLNILRFFKLSLQCNAAKNTKNLKISRK